MKMSAIIGFRRCFRNPDNKYDEVTRAFYLLFYAAGLIIFLAVGLRSMTAAAWIFGFICALLGATVYGTVARMIIDMIRKDRTKKRADILIRLFYVVFFCLAAMAFIAIGVQYHSAKTWVIAFAGAFGGALIYASIARLIITLARKDT